MSYETGTPFDNIESSYQYVDMLVEAIEEAKRDVEAEISIAVSEGAHRRQQALQLAAYNLNKLSMHVTTSRRILNDLRTLRRLLLDERHVQEQNSRSRTAGTV